METMRIKAAFSLLIVINLASSSNALRITDVTFPDYAMLKQTITMVCDYRVNEGEFVDSIKWYKDGAEFYRILSHPPREEDKIVTFPRPGIKLDREKSGIAKRGMHQLVLQDVTLESSGRYKCQITESKPPFHTEERERNLTVIIGPNGPPQIHGLQAEYAVDETINVGCILRDSFPAAELDFFINDEPVGENLKTRSPPTRYHEGIMLTSSIELRYPVRARSSLFYQPKDEGVANDELLIKCTAKIGNAYWQSVEEKTTVKRQGRMLESRSAGMRALSNVYLQGFLSVYLSVHFYASSC